MFKKTKKGVKIKTNFKIFELPKKNNNSIFVEDNGKSIFDALFSISEKENIEEIQIISFRISKTDLITLEKLKEKKKWNFKIKLLLSDSIPQMVRGTFIYLQDNKNFETHYENTHEKSAFIKTTENFYFITSSGNFNPIEDIEFLYIFNSETIYKNLLPL